LSAVIFAVVEKTVAVDCIDTLVLSDRVLQIELLARKTICRLEPCGVKVLHPLSYPANDGSISLGQALISATRQMP